MSTKVLLIGIGGVGSDIVSGIERITDEAGRKNIRFAIMDTDVNTINRITRSGFRGRVVQLSDNMTVGEYLDSNEEAKNTWFLENQILNNKPMTEGAGQVRSVSRLALELAVKKGKLHALEDLIGELYAFNGEDAVGALRILVVSSLAGGTGSGCILPISLYLRRFLAMRYARRDVIIRGMFLTADCFFSIVRNEYERSSLAGNAYAAVKELDAFMRQADGYLPGYYKEVCLARDDRKILTYNYCYLFSAKDAKGSGEISLPVIKDYLIQCIYTQILSPMQELNNSIEDNVLKSTMAVRTKHTEFKRYCAAGVQILKYPYKDVVAYLSLRKVSDLFQDSWLVIDRAYEEEKERLKKRLERGEYAELQDFKTFLIQYITTADESDQFAEKVRRDNIHTVKGREIASWEAYMKALEDRVTQMSSRVMKECSAEYAWVNDCINNLRKKQGKSRSQVEQLMKAFDRLLVKSEDALDLLTEASVKQFYNSDYRGMLYPHHLDYWCRDEAGFMNINSIRYFLYRVLGMIEKKLDEIEKKNREDYDILRNTRRQLVSISSGGHSVFEDSDEEEIKKSVREELNQISDNWRWNWLKRRPDTIRDTYEDQLKRLETYCPNYLYEKALEAGRVYLTEVLGQMEEFYHTMPYCRSVYEKRQEGMCTVFSRDETAVVRYVGVGMDYLNYLAETTTDVTKQYKMEAQFYQLLYEYLKKRKNGRGSEKGDTMEVFYQKIIPEFWTKMLEEEYGYLLNINIAQVIMQEGRLNHGEGMQYDYLKDRLEKTWESTIPRLMIGNRGEGESQLFCLYHESLPDMEGRAKAIVEDKLVRRGGTQSRKAADRYSLTFYKVVYNLSAADIEEFAVGRPEIEATRDSGYGFVAYHKVITLQKDTALSPHINWNWSNIFNMPDVNSEFTELRIKKIYKAVFIEWQQDNLTHKPVDKDIMEDELQYECSYQFRDGTRISGGSLNEIINKFSEFNAEVDDIHHSLQERIRTDQQKGKKIKNTCFWTMMVQRETDQYGIFRILYVFLIQEPERLWENDLIRYMGEAVLELVWDMIISFCNKAEADIVYEDIILKHLRYLPENTAGDRCRQEVRRYVQKKKLYDIDQKILLQTRRG